MKRSGQLKGAHQGFCNKILVSRTCLRCGAQFPSLSKSNRICIQCAAKREFYGAERISWKAGSQRSLRPADCLTPDEAGAQLGISGTAIKARIRRGTLKAIRTDDGRLWIKAAELGNGVPERVPIAGKRKASRERQPQRGPTFNPEAAREFGFRVEKAMPQTDGNSRQAPGAIG